MNGLSRLANCRIKSSNLYLEVRRGDVVQEGGREDGESSAKEQGGKGQQAMYVKNLPM